MRKVRLCREQAILVGGKKETGVVYKKDAFSWKQEATWTTLDEVIKATH